MELDLVFGTSCLPLPLSDPLPVSQNNAEWKVWKASNLKNIYWPPRDHLDRRIFQHAKLMETKPECQIFGFIIYTKAKLWILDAYLGVSWCLYLRTRITSLHWKDGLLAPAVHVLGTQLSCLLTSSALPNISPLSSSVTSTSKIDPKSDHFSLALLPP